jgi:hypothetical protein
MGTTLDDFLRDMRSSLTEGARLSPLFGAELFDRRTLPAHLDEIDEAITGRALRAEALRLVKDGAPIPRSAYTAPSTLGHAGLRDVVDPARVASRFADGATVVLETASLYLPRLNRFCKELESALGHSVDANVYVSPPQAQGFGIHYDAQDVLAVQVHGEKSWTLYGPVRNDPRSGGLVEDTDQLDVLDEFRLRPGDCLFVPRGMPHRVRTTDESSVHLTVSVNTIDWADVLTLMVRQALRQPQFGQSAPMGPNMLRDILAELPGRLESLSAAVGEVSEASDWTTELRTRPAFLEGDRGGLLRAAVNRARVGPADVVGLRPGVWPIVTMEAETRIQVGPRKYQVPESVARACSALREGPKPAGSLCGPGVPAAESTAAAQSLLTMAVAEVISNPSWDTANRGSRP